MAHIAKMDDVQHLKENPIPSELPFPEPEYRERVAKVRQRMDHAGHTPDEVQANTGFDLGAWPEAPGGLTGPGSLCQA